MTSGGFETAIPAIERPQTYASERMVRGIRSLCVLERSNNDNVSIFRLYSVKWRKFSI